LWHVLELYKQGSLDILEAIETLNSGDVLDSTPQNESNTYFTFPTENECNDFENNGLCIVDEQDYLEFIQLNYM
jgi:methionyl-tRNA formyltransferase